MHKQTVLFVVLMGLLAESLYEFDVTVWATNYLYYPCWDEYWGIWMCNLPLLDDVSVNYLTFRDALTIVAATYLYLRLRHKGLKDPTT